MHPASRAAFPMPARGKISNGGGEGGWGSWATISTRPWHGSAQDTKGRVNPVPPLQLRGWKEKKGRHTQKEGLLWGLPLPQFSEALTQRQTERGRRGPTLSKVLL